MPRFSTLSLERLETCHPDLQRLFRGVVLDFDCKVLEGARSVERQQRLYAQGRTEPGNLVTFCDGITRKSNHQPKADGWSHAIDVVPYPIDWQDINRFYRFAGFVQCRAIMLGISVKWGGDFTRLKDLPHWELA